MRLDEIIVVGSFAGLSAATYLAAQRHMASANGVTAGNSAHRALVFPAVAEIWNA